MALDKSSLKKLFCVLCRTSEEDETTGQLSAKEDIAAHENCLLYASALYCKNSPDFDDLFGFTVEDVKSEERRGKKLKCFYCKRSGATAGCECHRCPRSYHFPCAVKDKAEIVEDTKNGIFKMYCAKHASSVKKTDAVNGCSPMSSYQSDKPRRDSVQEEMSPRHESTSNKQDMISQAGSSRGRKRRVSQIMLDSDDDHGDADGYLAPLESDIESIPTEQQGPILLPNLDNVSINHNEPNGSVSAANALPPKCDGDETDIESDAESQSLLLPVNVCVESGQSGSESSPARSQTSFPGLVSGSVGDLTDQEKSVNAMTAAPPAQPGPFPPAAATGLSTSVSLSGPSRSQSCSSLRTSCPSGPPGDLAPRRYSQPPSETQPLPTVCVSTPPNTSSSPAQTATGESGGGEEGMEGCSSSVAEEFWNRCNEAGSTASIFSKLQAHISSMADRIQTQQATQQDYSVCLKLLEASGRSNEIITQLAQDFENHERELQMKHQAFRNAREALRMAVREKRTPRS